MALDPSIALGVRPIELPNQLAQYAQMQQIQGFQRQNELANRAIRQEDAANQAYANSIDPATGQIDPIKLRQNMVGANLGSKLPAYEKSMLETAELRNKVGKGDFELSMQKANQAIKNIANLNTREDIIADLTRNTQAGNLDLERAKQIEASIPQDPTQIPAWQLQTLRGMLEAKDRLEQQFTPQDYSGGTRIIATPKYGGGPAQVVAGSDIKKTATIADQLAREKFNWEKANPGFELKETENGEIVGVNKRTLQAFPVTVGGAAPAAAPMGGSPRIPAAIAPAITQVIPGMNSVLDQRAPVAPVTPQAPQAGTPLIGKASALTEGERKAATLLQRLRGSQNQLTQALLDDPSAAGPQAFAAAVGKLSQTGANLLNTEARQRVEASQLDILDAALTLGTGAAYTKEQLEGYRQSYFPVYGDKPKTIADKQARLKNVIDAANLAAGKAAKLVPTPSPDMGGSDIRNAADKILGGK